MENSIFGKVAQSQNGVAAKWRYSVATLWQSSVEATWFSCKVALWRSDILAHLYHTEQWHHGKRDLWQSGAEATWCVAQRRYGVATLWRSDITPSHHRSSFKKKMEDDPLRY